MESDNDSKDKLVEALRQASRGSARSKTARLREIFDEVEAARASGVSHKTIVATLERSGLKFDLGTFEITRFRIAKERREGNQQSAQQTTEQAHAEVASTGKSKLESSSVSKAAETTVELADELVRPRGITNGEWSDMQVKAAAAKRKKNLNSGE